MMTPRMARSICCCVIITLVTLLPVTGCSREKEDYWKQAKDYREHLRLRASDPGYWSIVGGELAPVFKVTVLNTGPKTVRHLKLVGELTGGKIYHDTQVVTPLDDAKGTPRLLRAGGGRIEFELRFAKKKITDAQKAALLSTRAAWRFEVTEVGFAD